MHDTNSMNEVNKSFCPSSFSAETSVPNERLFVPCWIVFNHLIGCSCCSLRWHISALLARLFRLHVPMGECLRADWPTLTLDTSLSKSVAWNQVNTKKTPTSPFSVSEPRFTLSYLLPRSFSTSLSFLHTHSILLKSTSWPRSPFVSTIYSSNPLYHSQITNHIINLTLLLSLPCSYSNTFCKLYTTTRCALVRLEIVHGAFLTTCSTTTLSQLLRSSYHLILSHLPLLTL